MKQFVLASLFAVFCLVAVNAQLSPVAQEVIKTMDWSVDPCVDFYNFSCGGWMASHPMPSDKSRIDRSFEAIGDYNTGILLNIVKQPSAGRVYDFWSACMDTQQIQADGNGPLNSMLQSLPSGQYAKNMAFLFKNGLSALFDLSTEIDSSDPSRVIYSLHQGGMTLPDPSYYKDNDVRQAYSTHLYNMFVLSGFSNSAAKSAADNVLKLESQLANINVPQDQLFDPFVSFNKMDWDKLIKLAPNVQFPAIIEALGLKKTVPVTLDAPVFFSRLSDLLVNTPASVLQDYLHWRAIHWLAPRLPMAFENENFNFFGKVLGGVSAPAPRNRTCLQQTDAVMPELLGRLYAEQAFPASSKDSAAEIFDAILSSFEINVQKLDWMDSDTMSKAIGKLEKILRLIGYPENPRNYTEFNFGRHYVENLLMTTQDAWNRQMDAAGGPSDRDKWEMSADTVNAYYSPTTNSMVFPAGILQTPFFNPNHPPAMNYGGIGLVGGHELTHSLDSQGRDYNGDGKLEDWWAPQTSAQFQKRVDCIINQYSKFSPLPGYYVNGNLTQGENIADAGGLKTAHSAYVNMYPNDVNKPSIVPNLSNEQLFFVGFAQSWCTKLTEAATRQRLLTDPHSPPRFRVIGSAINLPAFSQAFKCPVGSPMNPPQRCQIW